MRKLGRVLLVVAVSLSACDVPGGWLLDNEPPITRTRLEVWNRTEIPIFLVSDIGQRLDVPACGSAVANDFQTNAVRIRAAGGYIMGFGAPAPSLAEVRPLYLVLTAENTRTGLIHVSPDQPAQPLARCQGLPPVQPGV